MTVTLAASIGLAFFGSWALIRAVGKLAQAQAVYAATQRERALNEWMISDPRGYLDERACMEEWTR